MQLLKNAIVALVVGLLIVLLVGPGNLAQAAKNPDEVFVTNTAAKPVPIAGKVGIDPAANAVKLDPNTTVKLDANATIKLDPNAAVAPDLTGLKIRPFRISRNFTIANGADSNLASFDVPAGMTLVVESITGRVQLPSGQHTLSALLFTNVTAADPEPSVLHAQVSPLSNATQRLPTGQIPVPDVYTFNNSTRAYLKNTVTISVARAELDGDAQVNWAVHGYLVPTLP